MTVPPQLAPLGQPGQAPLVDREGRPTAQFARFLASINSILSFFQSANPVDAAPVTNSLGADVALNNVSNFIDGPSVNVGTSGTWFASGTVTCTDAAGAANFQGLLWDGNTHISSCDATITTVNFITTVTLSGFITNPVGNLRISVRDINSTSGKMLFNNTGLAKDSTITAFRIK